MKYWIYTLGLTLVFMIAACGDTTTTDQPEETTPEETVQSDQYELTPFTPSPSFEDATIESMDYEDGTFKFGVSGETYKLGEQTPDAPQKMCANSGQGQHIHLIVDNMPYAAKYVAEFDHEVADGEHYLLAFLSRSYHESIKTPQARVAQKVTVQNGSITGSEDITGPMLFYSRPKGTYVGKSDTEKVMLDFYLLNASLGSEYQIKASINGEDHMIDQWQPYYIDGLPMGDNTIELTLLDKNGGLVDVPLNPVSRTFTLKEDPAE